MYKVVIGLEIHTKLNTKSKCFSASSNIYNISPNENINEIDLGYPGVMPVLNKEALKKALIMSLALNMNICDYMIFDRKNYYYPDLTKGYQITQNTRPVGIDGYLLINNSGVESKVLIHDIHLEEDTASLEHFNYYSLIDYNRSGSPLIEIVTEPCIHSSEEAICFLETLRNTLLYIGVSDARADRGEIRCDVNISLMDQNATEFGTKTEMKNINSFINVKNAIEAEVKRQTEVLESGGKILQETRRFDAVSLSTTSMRSKEDSIDYKYFLEPNIPPIKINKEYLSSLKDKLPVLPYERYKKYTTDYSLTEVEANTLIKDKYLSDYFEEMIKNVSPKEASNWISSILVGELNRLNINMKDLFLTPQMITNLIKLVQDGVISNKQAKEVLTKSLETKIDPILIINESGLKQINDVKEIQSYIEEVFKEHPESKEQYKNGKTNILDFLVGMTMKKSKGSSNPSIVYKLIKEELER